MPPFHIGDRVKDWLSGDGTSPCTAIKYMRLEAAFSSQVYRNQTRSDLKKLFTITFQLWSEVDDLHDCTAVEERPHPFILSVLMLDCSEASINGWHMLNIS